MLKNSSASLRKSVKAEETRVAYVRLSSELLPQSLTKGADLGLLVRTSDGADFFEVKSVLEKYFRNKAKVQLVKAGEEPTENRTKPTVTIRPGVYPIWGQFCKELSLEGPCTSLFATKSILKGERSEFQVF